MRWVPQATFIMMEASQSLTAVLNLYETKIVLNTMQNEPPKAYIRMLLKKKKKECFSSECLRTLEPVHKLQGGVISNEHGMGRGAQCIFLLD